MSMDTDGPSESDTAIVFDGPMQERLTEQRLLDRQLPQRVVFSSLGARRLLFTLYVSYSSVD